MLKMVNDNFKWNCFNQRSSAFIPLVDEIMADLTGCDGFEYSVNEGVFTLNEPCLIEKRYLSPFVYADHDIPSEFYLHKVCLNFDKNLSYGKCTLEDDVFYVSYPIRVKKDDKASDNHMN